MMVEFEFKKMHKLYDWLYFHVITKRKIGKHLENIATYFIDVEGVEIDAAAKRMCDELNSHDCDGAWSYKRTK